MAKQGVIEDRSVIEDKITHLTLANGSVKGIEPTCICSMPNLWIESNATIGASTVRKVFDAL